MLTEQQIQRYARHVLLPDVGGTGQARLLAARVRVDDAHSPAASAALVYLIAAGVGQLVCADTTPLTDVGFLYERSDLGRPAAAALRDRARALNPDVFLSDPHDIAPPTPATAEGSRSAPKIFRDELLLRVDPRSEDPLESGSLAAASLLEEILR